MPQSTVTTVNFEVESMQSFSRRSSYCRSLLAAALAVVLVACGGGGGGNVASVNPITGILGGVAAVGSPIVDGTVTIICASGSVIVTKTGPAGAWQVGLREQALPCAVQVSGGTIDGSANGIAYHAVGTARGNVNLTPLTDLMIANLIGSPTPATWFSGLASSRAYVAAVTSDQVTATWLKLRNALPGLTELGSVHPMATSFVAKPGSIADDVLAALQTAMDAERVTHADLLACAAVQAFAAPPSAFGTALQQAYAALVAARTQTD